MAHTAARPSGKMTSYKAAFFDKTRLFWKYRHLMLLLLPGFLALVIFSYVPMYGIIIAFKDYKLTKGIFGSEWVGLKYFMDVFRLPEVLRAVKNSLMLGVYSFAVGFPATILFALLINEIRFGSFKKVMQTISYLPHFLSWVVVAGLVTDALSPSSGVIDKIIMLFGGKAIHFLIEPQYFRTIIIISALWKGIGWGSIIYLASIANADVELYDAAIVDGAGRFKRVLHITIPSMYPVISIGLIFSLSGLLGGADFEQVYNLVNRQTLSVGDILSIYTFRIGLGSFEYSLATALGLVNTLMGFLLLFISNKLAGHVSEYTLW